MHDPNKILDGARLLGMSVVRVELAHGVSIEFTEPDPKKIDPRQPAPMQALVMIAHAIAANYRSMTVQDRAMQNMVHLLDYLVRRVELLESRALIALPDDEHAEMAAVHRESIGNLATSLRAAYAAEAAKRPVDG